ncbi:HalOD1 output domain-containing protein [Natrialbaceae archaeon GCM10025810]|uniref:HalOD1 output domain-containing protein n=1 Tax=Halovalidus salilacus TaxID=3075124 RepID=UPI0036159626
MHSDTSTTDSDATQGSELPTRIVMAVAHTTEADPLDLDPLYAVVDPDALTELVTDAPNGVRIEFEYEGHTVTVRAGGHVCVD